MVFIYNVIDINTTYYMLFITYIRYIGLRDQQFGHNQLITTSRYTNSVDVSY